jgi:hypothetical protein
MDVDVPGPNGKLVPTPVAKAILLGGMPFEVDEASFQYSDQRFSLVITGADGDDPVACGDILEPDSEEFTDAGLALVQLLPTGDSSVTGYALLERIPLQRELDVTPTRARIVLFAPPATG